MSLYRCIDLLNKIDLQQTTPEEQALIERLRADFKRRLDNDQDLPYEPLQVEIDAIKVLNSPNVNLQKILEILSKMEAGRTAIVSKGELQQLITKALAQIEQNLLMHIDVWKNQALREELERYNATLKELDKFETPEYKIAALDQSDLRYQYRIQPGVCRGYTFAMVDSTLSPYKRQRARFDEENNPLVIHLNQAIHNYQIDQNKPNSSVKCTRLTREYFCPNPQKQAEELYSWGLKNSGKELEVGLRGYNAAHSVYLCVLPEGIRYMDPNHGAYFFKAKEDFLRFYVLDSRLETRFLPGRASFKYYQISQLTYDPECKLIEPKSFSGKIRTLLTGPKYVITWSFCVLNYFLVSLPAIALLLPIIVMTAFPALCATLGVLSILAAVTGYSLLAAANKQGLTGLSAIPHYLKESWYDFFHSEIEPLAPPEENIPENLEQPAGSINQALQYMPVKKVGVEDLQRAHYSPIDLFQNSRAEANCFVESVLESSCTFVYTPVLRAASPRTSSSAASFERGLMFFGTKAEKRELCSPDFEPKSVCFN